MTRKESGRLEQGMPGRVAKKLLDLLYPPVCPFCGSISLKGICDRCRKKIIYVKEPYCMHCGKPLSDESQEYCHDCARRMDADAWHGDGREGCCITQGRSLWIHREPVSGAVYGLKYKNKRNWGRIFGAEMEKVYGRQIRQWKIQEIIPVPLHASRQRVRGFNQSEIIARELSRLTGIPCRTDVLFRIKKTIPQKLLDNSQRPTNLKGAFAVSGEWKAAVNVLLIDDIYTTGATLEKSAKMLRKAGARNVYFLTVSIGQGI